MKNSPKHLLGFTAILLLWPPHSTHAQIDPSVAEVKSAMRKAAVYFHTHVAVHGGYVYQHELESNRRWGEGPASPQQIWVQPPGTPTVGMAYLGAYEATGDRIYLLAAADAANALVYGQLQSGGWTNSIDFDPASPNTAAYRTGLGKGKNNSSLDDGQTQSALTFLARADKALGFQDEAVHRAAIDGLEALLQAQFPNGGFPQVWKAAVARQPIIAASYPSADWKTIGKIKNYWDMYTLNDNVPGYVAHTLVDAYDIYRDERYLAALRRLGNFLLLAQMPDPQPGWAQQYNYAMQPIWARKFEPPAISGDETQEAIETLILIAKVTGDAALLDPVPNALDWLQRSLLADGQLARFYELKTNRPLFMQRSGDIYELTYDDSNLPSHYSWKTRSKLKQLTQQLDSYRAERALQENSPQAVASQGKQVPAPVKPSRSVTSTQAQQIIDALDQEGRWMARFSGERLVGQPKMPMGATYLSSETFSDNLSRLAEYILQQQP